MPAGSKVWWGCVLPGRHPGGADSRDDVISVVILDVADGQIQGVSSIVNPDKLGHLGPVADLRALLRERSQIP